MVAALAARLLITQRKWWECLDPKGAGRAYNGVSAATKAGQYATTAKKAVVTVIIATV